jgi:hypothetical protein
MKEISTIESPPIFYRQLCRQRLHNVLAVLDLFLLKHIVPNARADVPVEADERRVDRAGGLLAGGFDQVAEITQEPIMGLPNPGWCSGNL